MTDKETPAILRRGPFKGHKVVLAPQVEIKSWNRDGFVDRFMRRIFPEIPPGALLTDESAVRDFVPILAGSKGLERTYERITREYGVPVNADAHPLLVDVFRLIGPIKT